MTHIVPGATNKRLNDMIYSLWCSFKVVKCLLPNSPVYIFPQPTSCNVGHSDDKSVGPDISCHAKSLNCIMSSMFTYCISIQHLFYLSCISGLLSSHWVTVLQSNVSMYSWGEAVCLSFVSLCLSFNFSCQLLQALCK